jgi:beta-N-acetylhexosaminidase
MLASLSLEQKIAQMLHPYITPRWEKTKLKDYLKDIQPGGVFINPASRQQTQDCISFVQQNLSLPALISSDLENGPGRMIQDTTIFPEMMSLAATENSEYAYLMGKAAAIEGRSCGIHWSFAPVLDISANPHSPIVNTRSLGDRPETISRLAVQIIRGMQENGLCATAKHFPGDGYDDRDQHVCTTINPLSKEEWFEKSGKVFLDTIQAGVWSIMIGHIALPSIDPGAGRFPEDAPPATLSKKIVTELLRKKLGFEGLIITDAMNMGGFFFRGSREETVIGAIEAGCDMLLFTEMHCDFEIILNAVRQNRLSVQRIDESVRRILRLKEIVGLDKGFQNPSLGAEEKKEFEKTSQAIADNSITLVTDRNQMLPLNLSAGTKVFSYHIRAFRENHLDYFDELLKERGVSVTRFVEDDHDESKTTEDLRVITSGFDYILIHFNFPPSWMTNSIRPAGQYVRTLTRIFGVATERCVLISYGSPYHVYDFPHAPVFINAYSPDRNTQSAVLKVLTGQIAPVGKSPVDLRSPYRFKNKLCFTEAEIKH